MKEMQKRQTLNPYILFSYYVYFWDPRLLVESYSIAYKIGQKCVLINLFYLQ